MKKKLQASAKRRVIDIPEYNIWRGIKNRCHSKTGRGYENYGARGIRVADVWRKDFWAFFAHIGPRPSTRHQIDRIDNTRGYEPGNVRWTTPKENSRNKRNLLYITINGVTKCASAWAEHCGFQYRTRVAQRYRAGIRGSALLLPLVSKAMLTKGTLRANADHER